MKKLLIYLYLIITSFGVQAATNYYPLIFAAGSLNLVSSWTTDITGNTSVSPPINFTTTGDVFTIANTPNTVTSFGIAAAWTVSGSTSSVVVGDGSSAITFTASFATSAVALNVKAGATYTVNSTITATVSGAGGLICDGLIAGAGTIAMTATTSTPLSGGGTFTISTFNLAVFSSPSVSFLPSRTISGTLTFTGTNIAISATGISMGSASITITNNGIINTTGNISMTANSGGTSPNTVNFTNNNTIITSGNISMTNAGAGTGAANVTLSNPASATINTSGTIALARNYTGTAAIANVTITNTGVVNSTGAGGVTGNTATTCVWNNSGGSTLNIAGQFLPTGQFVPATTANTVNYYGTAAQAIKAPTTNPYFNLTIANPGPVSLGTTIPGNTCSGNLTIGGLEADGSTIASPTVTLGVPYSVKGNLVLNSGTFSIGSGLTMLTSGTSIIVDNGVLSAAPVFPAQIDVQYAGTAAVNSGFEIPVATNVLRNLTILKSGGVTMTTPATVNTKLTLSSGQLTTSSTNLLTIANTATTGVARTAGYVNGPLVRRLPFNLTSAATYLFPVGKGFYNPLELVNPTTNSGGNVDFQAEVFDGATGGSPAGHIASIASDHYWQGTIVSGSANLINTTVRLTRETSLGSLNAIGVSSTQSGSYVYAGGRSVNSPVNTITSNSQTTPAYYVMAVSQPPPAITYTNVATQACNGTVSLSATITDVGGTITTVPGLAPRLWYKKSTESNVLPATNTSASNGWKYVETTSSSSPFSFTVDYSLLTSAPAGGDLIQYFVVAQNNDTMISANTASFTTAPTNVALSNSGVFPVSGTKSYNITSGNITATSGANGTLSPPGVTSVSCNGSQAYSIAPNSCFVINDVLVDGISQGAISSYTFTNVTANHTISASFIPDPSFTVAASSNSPVCATNNLNLTSTVSGGVSPYNYSWAGPNSFLSTDGNPVISPAFTSNSGPYSITVTDANGCTVAASTTVTVNNCSTVLNLNLIIEGYYAGSGEMQPVMFNEGVSGVNASQSDTIIVELHNGNSPFALVEVVKAILMTNGSATAIFSPARTGSNYYIAIRHRNAVQTWSATPVLFNTVTSYNFINSQSNAYQNNQVLVDAGLWAFYNGDINQDENIDLIDFPPLDLGINSGLFGYYAQDLNGDGNVDLLDFPVLDANISTGVFSRHP